MCGIMTPNDAERIEAIREGLNFQDLEALDVWIGNGAGLDYDGIDLRGLLWSDDGYRVETEEDRESVRERQRVLKRKLDLGIASPSEVLWDRMMKTYIQHMSDALFEGPHETQN